VQDVVVASHSVATPVTPFGTVIGQVPGSSLQSGPVQVLGWATGSRPIVRTSQSLSAVMSTPASTGLRTRGASWETARATVSSPINYVNPGGSPTTDREVLDRLIMSRPRTGLVPDAVLDELATDSILWPAQQGNGAVTIPVLPTHRVTRVVVIGEPLPQRDQSLPPTDDAAGLAVLGLAAGLWARDIGRLNARKRESGRLFSKRNSIINDRVAPRRSGGRLRQERDGQ
jgi:hypothetical protein